LWLRGHVDRALVLARELIHEGRKLNQPVSQCVRLIHCTPIIAWAGERAEAQRLIDELIELGDKHSLRSYRDAATALQGKILVEGGRPIEGCNLLRAAIPALALVRATAIDTVCACSLAEGLAETGAWEDALRSVNTGIELAEQRGGTWDLPELLRITAVVLATLPPTSANEVEKLLCDAIDLAGRQGALVWKLRATTFLVCEQIRGGRSVAMNELSTVYSEFVGGVETPDLRAAQALLEPRAIRRARASVAYKRGKSK
jgi:hypothetical protein